MTYNDKVRKEEQDQYTYENTAKARRVINVGSDGVEGTILTGINYKTGNGGIDSSTSDIITILEEHHEIHEGDHYNYCDYQLNNGVNDIIEFVMTTPNTDKLIHFTFEAYSNQGITIELYAGVSGITGGTPIIPRNNRTDSSNVSGVILVKDPINIEKDGIRAQGYLAGAGRDSGIAKRNNELILTKNTSYLVRITSLANSNSISWCAEWYEHTDNN